MHREPVPNPTPPPLPISSAPAIPPSPPIPQPGPFGMPREIGPYQVQRVLGAGGMATVYAALQKQPRRTVALKVMKAGIVQSRGESALRRFKREIEILGKLNHPYIAAVYDAGTFDDGSGATPYFVMEYIPGALNILEYIARKELNQRERLKLFVKVCAAVEHGHRNRIIHRDLKPGNILIDQYGEPKVIDFGIATAAEVDVSHQTLQADAGRIVGTLQYMAPEQVETRGMDLDGRCDVYALGVLVYRIATGRPPYDLEALPVYEAVRIIREERPARPSEMNAEVRGDLETIILKAMEPQRTRRYRSAGSLGRDVVRYLANKPIKARRAGAVYRTTLFAKRNAVVLGVIAIIGVVAAAALGYTMWERGRLSAREACDRQAIAQRERELARQRQEIDARSAATQAAAAATPRDEAFTLAEHTGEITQLRFVASAAGTPLLASAASDHQLLLWNIGTREIVQRIDPLHARISMLAAAADGSTLAVAGASPDDPIAIIRCVDGQIVRTLRDVDGPVTSLALGASGEVAAWGASNLTLNVRATEPRAAPTRDNPRQEPRSMRSGTGAFTALAFSAGEPLLAAGTHGGVVWAWQPRGGEQQPANRSGAARASAVRLTGLRAPIVALALVEAGATKRRLIAVADDGRACTWHDDGQAWPAAAWIAAGRPVIAAAFSSGGSYLAVATAEGVQAWSMGAADASPQRVGALITVDDTPTAIAIDERGQWLATGSRVGDVRIATIPPAAAE